MINHAINFGINHIWVSSDSIFELIGDWITSAMITLNKYNITHLETCLQKKNNKENENWFGKHFNSFQLKQKMLGSSQTFDLTVEDPWSEWNIQVWSDLKAVIKILWK